MASINPMLHPAALPVAQLESLRSKINSMVESIQTLQWTIEQGGQNVMPTWPDVLSKYTILLSQSHNLSMSLVGPAGGSAARANGHGSGQANAPTNPYERLALHPSVPMGDAQLDNEVIPLLRNQQTTDVLRLENDTVRHLAAHMATRGSLGVLGMTSASPPGPSAASRTRFGVQEKKPEYADVLRECDQIRLEHDERVERAVRAVTLLREKYDWKVRMEVQDEEPEEFDWEGMVTDRGGENVDEDVEMNVDGDDEDKEGKGEESNESEEEEELEEVLGNGAEHSSPEGTPHPTSPDEVSAASAAVPIPPSG